MSKIAVNKKVRKIAANSRQKSQSEWRGASLHALCYLRAPTTKGEDNVVLSKAAYWHLLERQNNKDTGEDQVDHERTGLALEQIDNDYYRVR